MNYPLRVFVSKSRGVDLTLIEALAQELGRDADVSHEEIFRAAARATPS